MYIHHHKALLCKIMLHGVSLRIFVLCAIVSCCVFHMLVLNFLGYKYFGVVDCRCGPISVCTTHDNLQSHHYIVAPHLSPHPSACIFATAVIDRLPIATERILSIRPHDCDLVTFDTRLNSQFPVLPSYLSRTNSSKQTSRTAEQLLFRRTFRNSAVSPSPRTCTRFLFNFQLTPPNHCGVESLVAILVSAASWPLLIQTSRFARHRHPFVATDLMTTRSESCTM